MKDRKIKSNLHIELYNNENLMKELSLKSVDKSSKQKPPEGGF